ncbi:MAG: 3-oxoacyl-ACP reductase FabG [Deltaproteobacteria bacterium]|nr:3-oxoacyl-ACP reductase FabG [Deltaproteobacteria bacterium]
MFDLSRKVAIVTGASRGIGRAVAEALAGQGAHVIVNYTRSEALAEQVVQGILGRGGSAEAVRFDVADMGRAEQVVSEVAQRRGRLDILVANAGIAIDGVLLRIKEEDLDRVIAVNIKGTLACARAAIRVMMRARAGRVVVLSSVAGDVGNAGQAAYATTKAALQGLTKTLAREYASRNITVNAISPGLIETDMTAGLPAPVREHALRGIPLGRTGRPEEVAAAAVFLCSDEAGYVTGQILRVNGGLYV